MNVEQKIYDDTLQICFKFYAENDGTEFLRIKMNLCDLNCCSDFFKIEKNDKATNYYLHVKSLKQFIDYYLDGSLIHDNINHTEIYGFKNEENDKLYVHNAITYNYQTVDNYINHSGENEHYFVDHSESNIDNIKTCRKIYTPIKISSYEMVQLFEKFHEGYFKIDVLHQNYINKITDNLYEYNLINYATSNNYFKYVAYSLSSHNIRQFISYPNSYPINEKDAYSQITYDNYNDTTERIFAYSDCSLCTNNCCDNALSTRTYSITDKWYKSTSQSLIGTLSIYRGNLKITPIYITTMMPINTELSYGVINFVDDYNNIIQTNQYTIKNGIAHIISTSGDITNEYDSTVQFITTVEDQMNKLKIYPKSIITTGSIINNEKYDYDFEVQTEIIINSYTHISSNSILYDDTGNVYSDMEDRINDINDTANAKPYVTIDSFNNTKCTELIRYNYISNKVYVTFAIQLLTESKLFDTISHFIITIDKIFCINNLLTFNISDMPDVYKTSDVFIDSNSVINNENKNLNTTNLAYGSTIAKNSVLLINGEIITIKDDTVLKNIIKRKSIITPGSVINNTKIIDFEDNTFDYYLGVNTILKAGSSFIAREIGDIPQNDSDLNINGRLCKINNDYIITKKIHITGKYTFTENSYLRSTRLGLLSYQNNLLYMTMNGECEEEIELDTKLINKILKNSKPAVDSQLEYRIFDGNTELRNNVIIGESFSIPVGSTIASGSIIKAGSMINGVNIQEDYTTTEEITAIQVDADNNYYLDTIYIDAGKYNSLQDLVQTINNSIKSDIYKSISKSDKDIIFKPVIHINYETPTVLQIYDSDDVLYNIIIEWDSWDFNKMTAKLKNGAKINISTIINGKNVYITTNINLNNLDDNNSKNNEEIIFDFSDINKSNWTLQKYITINDFVYLINYDSAISLHFKDMYDDDLINDDLINDIVVNNKPFINLDTTITPYTFTFVTDIIPVEFTDNEIPNVINYLNLVKKYQNYEKYIDVNADKMLINKTFASIPSNFTDNSTTDSQTITNYIHDYINAEKYYVNFKQNQQSLWHKLGISPILIDKEKRPIININNINNIDYIINNDIYNSFDEIVYYNYLGSYYTETVYNSDWMNFSHRFRYSYNNKIETYNKTSEGISNGISKFDLWNSVWHNDKKPDLRVPLIFTLKISYDEDVENNLNLGNNNESMTTIDDKNISKDDNNDLVLSIDKTIDIRDVKPFYIYIDSKNHYPFEQGVNATLSLQYNTTI